MDHGEPRHPSKRLVELSRKSSDRVSIVVKHKHVTCSPPIESVHILDEVKEQKLSPIGPFTKIIKVKDKDKDKKT
jgi:hypothetical protein